MGLHASITALPARFSSPARWRASEAAPPLTARTINSPNLAAEKLAQEAAPDYTIANEIGVRPPEVANAGSVASNLDSAIEDNFKAEIKAHQNLDDQSIHASAKNGTLVIKGSVKTSAQKKEVGTLAKQVPNVQQVVNELEVKPGKHSTPSS